MKRLLILALLLFCCGINNPGSGAPTWVASLGPILPDIAINWQLNQVWTKSTGAITTPAAAGVTITRASAETNLLYTSPAGFAFTSVSSGVIASGAAFGGRQTWESRTNFLLNSTALVNQTTGSLANGTYTLWINCPAASPACTVTMGSGTATGCGTSVASQGTPISFTLSGAAGTCTITVSTSGIFGQLELNTGSVSTPTPGIVTAGGTATRASDVITLPVTVGTAYTIFEQAIPQTPASYATNQFNLFLSDGTANNRFTTYRSGASGNVNLFNTTGGTNSNPSTGVSWAQNASGIVAASTVASSQSIYFNNGNNATSAGGLPVGVTTLNFGSNQGGTSQFDGIAIKDAIWLTQAVPSGQLQSMQ